MDILLKNIFNFIAKYNISMRIERCPFKDGFRITIERCGRYQSSVISDVELTTAVDDYLLFVIKGMVHKLLEEEQKAIKLVEQLKKRNLTIDINLEKTNEN